MIRPPPQCAIDLLQSLLKRCDADVASGDDEEQQQEQQGHLDTTRRDAGGSVASKTPDTQHLAQQPGQQPAPALLAAGSILHDTQVPAQDSHEMQQQNQQSWPSRPIPWPEQLLPEQGSLLTLSSLLLAVQELPISTTAQQVAAQPCLSKRSMAAGKGASSEEQQQLHQHGSKYCSANSCVSASSSSSSSEEGEVSDEFDGCGAEGLPTHQSPLQTGGCMPQRAVVGSAHSNDATASTAAGKRKKKPRGGRKVRQRRNREAAEAAAAVGASTMHSASACAGVLRLGLYAELKAWERQQAREHKLAPVQEQITEEMAARELRFALPDARPACAFWASGRCTRGADCPYPHSSVPAIKLLACSFHARGACRKGSSCRYSHAALGSLPCPEHVLYGRCAAMARHGGCPYAHKILEEELSTPLRRFLLKKQAAADDKDDDCAGGGPVASAAAANNALALPLQLQQQQQQQCIPQISVPSLAHLHPQMRVQLPPTQLQSSAVAWQHALHVAPRPLAAVPLSQQTTSRVADVLSSQPQPQFWPAWGDLQR